MRILLFRIWIQRGFEWRIQCWSGSGFFQNLPLTIQCNSTKWDACKIRTGLKFPSYSHSPICGDITTWNLSSSVLVGNHCFLLVRFHFFFCLISFVVHIYVGVFLLVDTTSKTQLQSITWLQAAVCGPGEWEPGGVPGGGGLQQAWQPAPLPRPHSPCYTDRPRQVGSRLSVHCTNACFSPYSTSKKGASLKTKQL